MSRTKVARDRVGVAARLVALLLFVPLFAACGPLPDESATEPTLADTVAAQFEGVQLDVWGGGSPSPGSTTTMFVHHGNRAAEVYWKTDGWCLARTYTWSVRHLSSARTFDVHYVVDREFTDCVMDTGDSVDLRVFDVHHTLDGTTYLGAYADTWTVRTTCSTAWNAPSPCGFREAAAVVPQM